MSQDSGTHRPMVRRLLVVVVASIVLSFAMVPLYDVMCRLTGLNGKTGEFGKGGLVGSDLPPSAVDRSRLVTVEFTGTVMPGLDWDMQPLTSRLAVHPGELQQVRYRVRNRSDRRVVAQAVPSVSPGQAARHFEKLECFCFTQQPLEPGETAELPLVFIVRPEIDPDIPAITLSYAFFDRSPPGGLAAAAAASAAVSP